MAQQQNHTAQQQQHNTPPKHNTMQHTTTEQPEPIPNPVVKTKSGRISKPTEP